MLVCIAWATWFASGNYTAQWGLYPRETSGLIGIITSPFIHDVRDYAHIVNNSVAFLFMGWMLFYFYKPVAWKVLLILWLAGGFWTWIIGRPSYHIGMSGLVYGLGFYLVTAAVLRKNAQLMAASLIIILEYGSMVWGILPVKHVHISWEGHLTGAIAGLVAAFYYRKVFPSQVEPPREWPDDEEDEDKWWEDKPENENDQQSVTIVWQYKPKDTDKQ
jgi:membrane associated rhomboid family serine protease